MTATIVLLLIAGSSECVKSQSAYFRKNEDQSLLNFDDLLRAFRFGDFYFIKNKGYKKIKGNRYVGTMDTIIVSENSLLWRGFGSIRMDDTFFSIYEGVKKNVPFFTRRVVFTPKKDKKYGGYVEAFMYDATNSEFRVIVATQYLSVGQEVGRSIEIGKLKWIVK